MNNTSTRHILGHTPIVTDRLVMRELRLEDAPLFGALCKNDAAFAQQVKLGETDCIYSSCTAIIRLLKEGSTAILFERSSGEFVGVSRISPNNADAESTLKAGHLHRGLEEEALHAIRNRFAKQSNPTKSLHPFRIDSDSRRRARRVSGHNATRGFPPTPSQRCAIAKP